MCLNALGSVSIATAHSLIIYLVTCLFDVDVTGKDFGCRQERGVFAICYSDGALRFHCVERRSVYSCYIVSDNRN